MASSGHSDLSNYWTNRYKQQQTGWDIGSPSTPLVEYFNQVDNHNLEILIPGCGNAYEAAHLFLQGFKYIDLLDISSLPLQNFANKYPSFPSEQLINDNFFKHQGQYDIIVEQTFFCSFEPNLENRHLYGERMNRLLKRDGKLIGVFFEHPPSRPHVNRPFGASFEEYVSYFESYLDVVAFAPCYNSIPPRMGREFFAILRKK